MRSVAVSEGEFESERKRETDGGSDRAWVRWRGDSGADLVDEKGTWERERVEKAVWDVVESGDGEGSGLRMAG